MAHLPAELASFGDGLGQRESFKAGNQLRQIAACAAAKTAVAAITQRNAQAGRVIGMEGAAGHGVTLAACMEVLETVTKIVGDR